MTAAGGHGMACQLCATTRADLLREQEAYEALRAEVESCHVWMNDTQRELDHLRAEIERMRPVYEAAKSERLANLAWDAAVERNAEMAECVRLSDVWEQCVRELEAAIDAARDKEPK